MTIQTQAAEDSSLPFGRSLGDSLGETSSSRYYRFSRKATWRPAINVYEDPARLYVCVELAGLTKDDVEVEVTGSRIAIRGERPAPLPSRGERPDNVVRMEIDSGPFERTIEMPARADMDTVEARFDEGFLWITVAKRAP
jgi:HSP20 family protein